MSNKIYAVLFFRFNISIIMSLLSLFFRQNSDAFHLLFFLHLPLTVYSFQSVNNLKDFSGGLFPGVKGVQPPQIFYTSFSRNCFSSSSSNWVSNSFRIESPYQTCITLYFAYSKSPAIVKYSIGIPHTAL